MSIFNGTSFNDYREGRLRDALTRIANSDDPAGIQDTVISQHRLGEIGIEWDGLETYTKGTEVFMSVPITGEAFLFMLRVSTNQDPLPNCSIAVPENDDQGKLVWRYLPNQPVNSIINAALSARTVAQQHVNFLNEGIRLFNQTLEAKVREGTRQRLVSFTEAGKIATALLEKMNPAKV